MKTTLKKLSIPKPNGGYDYLCADDFVTKEELAALKDMVYKLYFDKGEVTDLHPFYIKSLEDENVVYNSVFCRLSSDAANVEYSYDGTWHNLAEVESIILNKDECVYFRYIGEDYLQGEVLTSPTKTFEVGGDLRSVIYGDMTREEAGEEHYKKLFYDVGTLVSAEKLNLGVKKVGVHCCTSMFDGCTSLTTAPELPAITLASHCYYEMFRDCSSLTTAPELPATKLAAHCYAYMFYNCISLVTAPELPATSISISAYAYMFSSCKSLTTAPELPATNFQASFFGGRNYVGMFSNCTSLVVAPKLPATLLTVGCYASMFSNCTSLTVAPELPATKLVNGYSDGDMGVSIGCYSGMFAGTSIKKISLPAEHISDFAYINMFSSCKSLEEVEILATSVSSTTTPVGMFEEGKYAGSLYSMFSGCTNLRKVFCNLREIPTDVTYNWLNGVAAEGEFVQAEGANWERGVSGIPEGWTIQDYAE